MNASMRRASLGEMYSPTSNPRTEPPKRTGKAETSNRVMGPIPLSPFKMASQADFTVLPTGEMMPRPVTTTRRLLTRYLYEDSTDGRDGARDRSSEHTPTGRGLTLKVVRRRCNGEQDDRAPRARNENQALLRRSLMYSIACCT